MLNIYEQVDANKRKSLLIIAGFVVFIAVAAYLMSQAFGFDPSFVGLAFIFSGIGSLVGYFAGDGT